MRERENTCGKCIHIPILFHNGIEISAVVKRERKGIFVMDERERKREM